MTATRESQEQVVHHDGRVDLRDPSAIVASRYANAELAPTPTKEGSV
ncbi:hypothetical protein ABN034_03165 [Actinopolymorpha sp. B11F2]